jgi:hypothetical protein
MKLFRIFSFIFLLVASLWVAPLAFAGDPKPTIRDDAFHASYVSQSIPDPIQIEAGTARDVTIRFKNTGTTTWPASGPRYVSAYTVEDRYRDSLFATDDWVSPKQTPAISKTTAPGEIAELVLPLRAPSTPGSYVERFYLAAENYSWMDNGYFFLKIEVLPKQTPTTPPVVEQPDETPNESASGTAIRAQRGLYAPRRVSLAGGKTTEVTVMFRNTGDVVWNDYGLIANLPDMNGTPGTFADASWKGNQMIMTATEPIAPGERLVHRFTMTAPTKQGSYTLEIRPVVDGEPIDEIAPIAVTVTSDAYFGGTGPIFEDPIDLTLETARLEEEPYIRVGLWKNPEETVRFRAIGDDFLVYKGLAQVGEIPQGSIAAIGYDASLQAFTYSPPRSARERPIRQARYIRLVPKHDPHALFELVNMDRDYQNNNYNTYHGSMEYRLTEDKEDRYVINELLFEDYVEGIGETSNGAPIEMIKANLVAARTYAYVTMQGTKHDKRFFDVVAHTGDQLYLGAERETISPNVVAAAQATRGYMVTYDGNVVVTPYFGNSDGRTRSWAEVWGGNRPWLQSVSATYDARDGKRLFGHGVGMSQRDAAYRAEEEGLSWRQLVKYYYTDVRIQKMYD